MSRMFLICFIISIVKRPTTTMYLFPSCGHAGGRRHHVREDSLPLSNPEPLPSNPISEWVKTFESDIRVSKNNVEATLGPTCVTCSVVAVMVIMLEKNVSATWRCCSGIGMISRYWRTFKRRVLLRHALHCCSSFAASLVSFLLIVLDATSLECHLCLVHQSPYMLYNCTIFHFSQAARKPSPQLCCSVK